MNFLADMGECPPGLTLHRIDNDGDYEPGNCKWATLSEQNKNKRYPNGERTNSAKLTEGQVRAIRKDQRIQRKIARDYGVDQSVICLIKQGKIWRHVS